MVRLFVPSGDGQHAVVPRQPYPLPASPETHAIPKYACIGAAVWTGLQSIVRGNVTGAFVRTTAILTPLLIANQSVQSFVEKQAVAEVFKNSGIRPQPWKLIRFEEPLNLDSWALGGAIVGLCIAARGKSLPGVLGWDRYIGASAIGWAVGSSAGAAYFKSISPGGEWAKAILVNEARRRDYVDATTNSDFWGPIENSQSFPRIFTLYSSPWRK
ncbi:hypothetical protein B0J11DRAFT_331850 [Dendryphion nanum]|uniref:Uncharacterized protein n=1 Tax=Dendryphion nanum TaxID=256645 RepID=A0A9P9DSA1_9PLEO|nr:hypothetical protein B0J11DRAFT_331850 [Dendryphion nanum]